MFSSTDASVRNELLVGGGEHERRFLHRLATELFDRSPAAPIDVLAPPRRRTPAYALACPLRPTCLALDVVEVRLEVLERQREVEDFSVPPARFRERLRDERRDRRGPVDGARRERAAQDEARAGHAVHLALHRAPTPGCGRPSMSVRHLHWLLSRSRAQARNGLTAASTVGHVSRLGERAIRGDGLLTSVPSVAA